MTDYSQKKAGNYTIIRKLGDGGFATVYLGQHTVLEKKAAVKFLLEDWIDEPDVVARFFDEARTMERLHDHPDIVKIIDIATMEKCREEGLPPYFIMEYIDGKSLEDVMKSDEGFTLEDIVKIMSSALSALQHCHDHGVVHRDIKPSNFMITSSGEVKLTDFGIAKACKNTSKTGEGLTLGSTDYMSPEQALGKRDLDYRSDIYSLGVTLYQMVCDQLPFIGDSPNAIALKHIQEKPVAPETFSEHIPKRLSNLILKAMEKDKEHRFQSCNEMLEALKKLDEPEEPVLAPVAAVDLMNLKPDADEESAGENYDVTTDSHATTRKFAAKPPAAVINAIRVILIFVGFTGIFLLAFKGYSIFTQVTMSLDSVPEEATVIINRENLGVTPLKLTFPPSGYLISFTLPDYATSTVYFDLQARQSLDLKARLLPLVVPELESFISGLDELSVRISRLPGEPPKIKKDVPAYERAVEQINAGWKSAYAQLMEHYEDERFHAAFIRFCEKNANLQRGAELYQNFIKEKPETMVFAFAGLFQKRLKNDKEALRLYMESWTKNPNNRFLLNCLGDYFVDEKNVEKARQYYQMSLFLYPEQTDISKKLEKLD